MKTREMVTCLMIQCMDDATRIATARGERKPWQSCAPDAIAVTLMATAMFTARWERGSTRLVSAIRRADAAAEADGTRTD